MTHWPHGRASRRRCVNTEFQALQRQALDQETGCRFTTHFPGISSRRYRARRKPDSFVLPGRLELVEIDLGDRHRGVAQLREGSDRLETRNIEPSKALTRLSSLGSLQRANASPLKESRSYASPEARSPSTGVTIASSFVRRPSGNAFRRKAI